MKKEISAKLKEDMKNLDLYTSYSDTTPDDYLNEPEYMIREVLMKTFDRIFNNSGITKETPEQLYALWTFVDEFVSLEEKLEQVKKDNE